MGEGGGGGGTKRRLRGLSPYLYYTMKVLLPHQTEGGKQCDPRGDGEAPQVARYNAGRG